MTADDKAREIASEILARHFGVVDESWSLHSAIAAALEAARAEALEEAAKIAEGLLVQQEGGVFTDEHDAKDRHGSSVAAAIRARKTEKETDDG